MAEYVPLDPAPPSRLTVTHDDGTLSTWRRDRLYGTRKVLNRIKIFICEIDDGSGQIPSAPDGELDLWGDRIEADS